MGFSTDLFVSEVDDNLTCPICFDVFENPHSLTNCGHTFCSKCLQNTHNLTDCPTCRGPCADENVTIVNFGLKGIIGNLQIRCRNNGGGLSECPSRQRPRTARGAVSADVEEACTWMGKLKAWSRHAKTECYVPTILCKVKGCGFLGSKNMMMVHAATSMTIHHELLVQDGLLQATMKLKEDFQAQLRDAEKNSKKELEDQLKAETKRIKKELEEQLEDDKKKMKKDFQGQLQAAEKKMKRGFNGQLQVAERKIQREVKVRLLSAEKIIKKELDELDYECV